MKTSEEIKRAAKRKGELEESGSDEECVDAGLRVKKKMSQNCLGYFS